MPPHPAACSVCTHLMSIGPSHSQQIIY
jgi:hypothetical protein